MTDLELFCMQFHSEKGTGNAHLTHIETSFKGSSLISKANQVVTCAGNTAKHHCRHSFFCHVGARSSHVSNAQNSELQSSGVQITNSLHTLGFGPSRPTLSQSSTISHRYTQNKYKTYGEDDDKKAPLALPDSLISPYMHLS